MSETKTQAPPSAASHLGEAPPLPSEVLAARSERPCPECGEKVRAGLVRCWNCGAFLKKEMAERYAQMQANPAPIIFSQVPEGEAVVVGDIDDEADFELKIMEPAVVANQAASDPDAGVYSLKGAEAVAEAAGAGKPAAERSAAPKAEPAAGGTEEGSVAHSVATAGDVLLEGAMSEEKEQKKRRKQRGVSMRGGARTPGGFVIYCPYGCRIEVKDQHRGMSGRCPKCRAPFVIPVDPPDYEHRERETAAAAVAAATSPTGAWTPWLTDLHLHTVAPEKLKLRAGSLAREFVEVDAGFSSGDGMLLINLAQKKSGGLFGGGGGGDKKKPDARAAIQQHLREGKPPGEAPGSDIRVYSKDDLAQLRVAQPAANPTESMFAGVPVFGEKQVAVQLPLAAGQPPQFLSFGIMGFRTFAKAVQGVTGGPELTAPGAPATEEYVEYTCHYSEVPIRALQDVAWYQADPTAGVVLAGWKCAACGLAVSEDARKKENLGGKGGKGIAKAKCPKCSNKFGEVPLYTLPSQLTQTTMAAPAT